MAYCTVCPFVPALLTGFTVMLEVVGVPLTVGTPLTAAPSPFATALAVIIFVGVMLAVALGTLAAGMLVDGTILVLALYASGVPVMFTVTTVSLVLTA